jgi:hypothetical protein
VVLLMAQGMTGVDIVERVGYTVDVAIADGLCRL